MWLNVWEIQALSFEFEVARTRRESGVICPEPSLTGLAEALKSQVKRRVKSTLSREGELSRLYVVEDEGMRLRFQISQARKLGVRAFKKGDGC